VIQAPGSACSPRRRTFKLTTGIGARTAGLALGFLAAALIAAEIIARIPAVRVRLLVPGLGSSHRQFEIEMARLEDFVAEHGTLDCVFVGSSVVGSGLDPEVFRVAHAGRSGRDIRCFNLGIFGVGASAEAAIADVVRRRYHPALLIYMVNLMDLGQAADRSTAAMIASVPWVRYQRGEFTIAGWLADHSAAYREYLAYRNWTTLTYWDDLRDARAIEIRTRADGFVSAFEAGRWTDGNVGRAVVCRVDALAAARFSEAALHGLDTICGFHADGVRVVLVEAPAPRVRLTCSRLARLHYRQFVDLVARRAAAAGVPFWRTLARGPISNEGWADSAHLNATGAAAFSRWLGEKVAASMSS